jgi:hypothetical protein
VERMDRWILQIICLKLYWIIRTKRTAPTWSQGQPWEAIILVRFRMAPKIWWMAIRVRDLNQTYSRISKTFSICSSISNVVSQILLTSRINKTCKIRCNFNWWLRPLQTSKLVPTTWTPITATNKTT